ncbi:actin-like ATPase domain-containing protein [Rickenella mellea]|uniref:Phosphotransferase n=1 Tax=Rickenella mellea TaxID=50990 RepID=A0A4Y7PXG8_9AGAM|nr:actin-like ATPase domain-containing protein [Rickenella mellea]
MALRARNIHLDDVLTTERPCIAWREFSESRPPRWQKLISGRYLGEILRLIICELTDKGVLFLGQNTYKIEKAYSFDTAFLSLMESDRREELLMIISIFTHFFALGATLAERQFFRALARLVGRRAPRLSACGITAIVGKMRYLEEGSVGGADGSLSNK